MASLVNRRKMEVFSWENHRKTIGKYGGKKPSGNLSNIAIENGDLVRRFIHQ